MNYRKPTRTLEDIENLKEVIQYTKKTINVFHNKLRSCKFCNRPIVLAMSQRGKMYAVDPGPEVNGVHAVNLRNFHECE